MGTRFARSPRESLVGRDAALERVARLVAHQPPVADVFASVTREAGMLLGARMIALVRVEGAEEAVVVAGWSADGTPVPVGSRGALDRRGPLGRMLRTGRRVGLDRVDEVRGAVAVEMRRLGIPSAVGRPIVLDGRIWGALSADWPEGVRTPPGAEDQIAAFAELTAYAIRNEEQRHDLLASRARLVEAGDEQLRRVGRDVRDAARGRLGHAIATLQRAERREDTPPAVRRLLAQACDDVCAAVDELRDLAGAIHAPPILTDRGLAAAVQGLADRAPLRVRVDIPDARFPAFAESTAYCVAREGLANVARHAMASTARVAATERPDRLLLLVEDDGVGGAAPAPGSGLAGLADRTAAFGGTLIVDSPRGEGTRLRATIPLRAPGTA